MNVERTLDRYLSADATAILKTIIHLSGVWIVQDILSLSSQSERVKMAILWFGISEDLACIP